MEASLKPVVCVSQDTIQFVERFTYQEGGNRRNGGFIKEETIIHTYDYVTHINLNNPNVIGRVG